ncbi:MAG: hypothetical protein D6E12_10315 [Desulfovibrio sp.]|nr:MAG: hypothetical protein D6E12_10315 [Desulfovibrio sp.]
MKTVSHRTNFFYLSSLVLFAVGIFLGTFCRAKAETEQYTLLDMIEYAQHVSYCGYIYNNEIIYVEEGPRISPYEMIIDDDLNTCNFDNTIFDRLLISKGQFDTCAILTKSLKTIEIATSFYSMLCQQEGPNPIVIENYTLSLGTGDLLVTDFDNDDEADILASFYISDNPWRVENGFPILVVWLSKTNEWSVVDKLAYARLTFLGYYEFESREYIILEQSENESMGFVTLLVSEGDIQVVGFGGFLPIVYY